MLPPPLQLTSNTCNTLSSHTHTHSATHTHTETSPASIAVVKQIEVESERSAQQIFIGKTFLIIINEHEVWRHVLTRPAAREVGAAVGVAITTLALQLF